MITLQFEQRKNLPASTRFVYVADDFSEVFIYYPHGALERKCAFLSAAFDGVGLFRGYRRQTYFPISWLSREYPKSRDDFETMKNKLVEQAKAHIEAAVEE